MPITEKVAILKRHLLDKVPVSDLCDETRPLPQPVLRLAQKVLRERPRSPSTTAARAKAVEDAKDHKIQQLEAKLQRKNEVMAELMEAHTELKKSLGETLKGCWVPHDTRDQIVDFVRSWSDKTEIPVAASCPGSASAASKFQDWKPRFGKVNEHNAWVPATTGSPTTKKTASATSLAATPGRLSPHDLHDARCR